MKKYAYLTGLAILVLIIDGTMTYDIFDTKPETLKVWLVVGLIVILGLIIVIADASKKPGPKNDSQ